MDIGLSVAAFWVFMAYQTRHLVEAGEQLPDYTLESVEGERVSLVDDEAERTLVYAWATWCGVCTAQTGALQWAKGWMADDVAVRAVVFDYKSARHAKASADEKGMTSHVLLGTREVREALNVKAYPTFYVLDASGRVVSRTQGYTTSVGLWWRAL
jgi:peroxiredoxin